MKKVAFTLLISMLILSACEGKPKSYTSEKYTVTYTGTLSENSPMEGNITIKTKNGHVVIGNYQWDVGPAISEEEERDTINKLILPQKVLGSSYEDLTIALFYKTGDEETQKALEEISNSIQLK